MARSPLSEYTRIFIRGGLGLRIEPERVRSDLYVESDPLHRPTRIAELDLCEDGRVA